MKFEIKSWYSGAVLFSMETESMKLCVEAAIKSKADLSYANLRSADLSSAELSYADLRFADLRFANLRSANLRSANLLFANLSSAKNSGYAIACTRILPEGDLVVWKKAGGKIVKMLVPKEAKRSHAFGRKCRAEFVDVLEIEGATEVATYQHGPRTVYRVGGRVTADGWCDDFTQECAQGIHFFITRAEAEAW